MALTPSTPRAEATDATAYLPSKKRILAKALQIVCGTHILALADQAIVSCTSFLTTVVIARWTFPSELGSYSIATSLLFPLFCVQESLISLPYTIQRHRSLGTPAQYAGSSLAHNAQLSVLAVVALALGAMGLSVGNAPPELVSAIWVLAAVSPFALLREFGRRFAFAHLQMGQALTLDLAAAAIQIAGILWLGLMGWMSAAAACAALGVSYAVVGIVWLYLARPKFSIRGFHVRRTMIQSWALGKWLGASQLTTFLRTYAAYWLLAWAAGTAATGVYAACTSVVAFANPLILGFSNVLAPKAALALSQGGSAALVREVIRDTLMIAAVMGLFCTAIALVGEDVMHFLYQGDPYKGQGHTLTVLAFAAMAQALSMPPSNALASFERPRAIFWTTLFAGILTLFLVWNLVGRYGVEGAAYGVLGGSLVAAAGRWISFLVLAPQNAAKADPAGMSPETLSEDIIQVLQHLTQSAEDREWVIESLGEGYQARVCAVRLQSQAAIWQTHSALVIKLYKPRTDSTSQLVREQFDSLLRLHAAVRSFPLNGWTIAAPEPVYLCTSPLALVMTMVTGRNLEWCLQSGDNITPDVLDSGPRAIAAALKEYWSSGHPYGELALGNILSDIDARELALVDSGVRHNSHFCNGVARRWYPASRDLAYLLYDLGVEIAIGNHSARARKEMFIVGILRAVVETVGPIEERREFLDEIEACVSRHLKTLEPSWSPPGLWHLIVKRIASRRIDRLLARLRADALSLGDRRASNCS
jgi:O-antigen/teichoic acid export membrane protein